MKRQLIFLLLFVAAAVVFLDCSKEYSYEGGYVIPVAKGTLKIDTSGNCLPVVIGGTFYDGVTPFSDTNFVMIEMNVTSPGTYYIKTDLQNGFQLFDSGYFHVAGINTAFLRVIGTPILHIPTDFTVSFNATECTFTVNVLDSTGTHLGGGGGGTAAAYTLAGAPNACTNATTNGNYFTGAALGAGNTVVLPVNVTSVGSYSLTTTAVNGYKFSGSGTFTATGAQNITLVGSGIPITAETDAFKPQIGSSSCTFNITVAPLAGAVFTLAGSPNACTSAAVNGSYSVSTALNSSNTVVVGVNVTSGGSYAISTNTVNGYKFSASGTFTSTGIQYVTLIGSGTPATGETDIFKPQAGSSSCTFSVTVIGQAAFTLAGAPNACSNFTVNGTYTELSPLNSTNTVAVNVNVTAIGNYTLSSNTVNGITFSASGTFTGTGAQTVTLSGTGTPPASGTSTFTVVGGSGSCSFSVPVAVSTSPCTSLTADEFTLSSTTGVLYYNITGLATIIDINNYELQVPTFAVQSLTIDFQGTSQPAAGIYTVGAGIAITSTDPGYISNGITWKATSGLVYVTNDPRTGGIIVQFCNLQFTGTSFMNSNIYPAVGQAQEESLH